MSPNCPGRTHTMSSNGTTVMYVTYLASCGLQRWWASALPHRRHEATWEGKLPAGEGQQSKAQAQGNLANGCCPPPLGQVAVALFAAPRAQGTWMRVFGGVACLCTPVRRVLTMLNLHRFELSRERSKKYSACLVEGAYVLYYAC